MAFSDRTGGGHRLIQYWHSAEPPPEVRKMIADFRARNRGLRHLLFDAAGAEKLIADNFSSREVSAFRACAVPSMQADYFRYCAILALGGVYSDVGFRCKRPLAGLVETANGGMLFRQGSPPEVLINGFFLFAAPGHPLPRLALDVATANIEHRVAEKVNMVTGPWIFTGLSELHHAGSFDAALAKVPPGEIEQLARHMLNAVGSFDRVKVAFEDVRIESPDRLAQWVGVPVRQPLFKTSDTRWIDWPRRRGSIFRTP